MSKLRLGVNASQPANHWVRIGIFALCCFALSLIVIAIDLLKLSNWMAPGLGPLYETAVAACGILAIVLRVWRRDAPFAANLLASLSCFVMPAVGLYVVCFYIVPMMYAGWPKDVSPL